MHTVDIPHGNNTYEGDAKETRGNHKGMPSRTAAYFPTDDRGHIQASMLGGSNDPTNIVPMDRNVNRGSYLHMEYGERDALRSGAAVHSEKTAFSAGDSMGRPTAFMVTDTITRPDGSMDRVYHSFTNVSNEEQQSWADTLEGMDVAENAPSTFEGTDLTTEDKEAMVNTIMGIRETYQSATYMAFDYTEAFNQNGEEYSASEENTFFNGTTAAEGVAWDGFGSAGDGEGEADGEYNDLGGIGMSL